MKKPPTKKIPTPTEEQCKAIEHSGCPLLVLAGPGTGKTTVLALRVLYLLKKKIATRQEILAVTFTTKAAGEMRERLLQYGLSKRKHPWIGTLHSVAKRVLHERADLAQLPGNFLIANSGEARLVVNDACEWTANKLNLDVRSVRKAVAELRKAWYKGLVLRQISNEPLLSLNRRYRSLMQFYRATDFDGLLIHALTILGKSKPTLSKYQKKAKALLVDEYQDINGAQHDLLKMFGGNTNDIFAVGDDDQSIYGWRGGDPALILDFAGSFPKASRITLTESQRCPGHILNGALAVVSRNKTRVKKQIKPTGTEGERIRILVSKSENAEAKWIADWIKKKLSAKVYKPSNITVLSTDPTIADLAYRDVLRRGIKAVRRTESPLNSAPVSRIISLLRSVVNPTDNLAVRRSLQEGPIKGIGHKGIARIVELAEASESTIWDVLLSPEKNSLTKWAKPVRAFVKDIRELRRLAKTEELPDFVERVACSIGVADDDRVGWLLGQAEQIGQGSSLGDFVKYLLSETILDVSQESPQEEPEDAVKFFTTYLVKGLEAKVVFVIGLEDQLFPDPSKDIQEERRLLYVAMTRAKSELFLCTSKMRKVRGFQFYNPSPFIGEISEQNVKVIYNM